MRNNDMAAPDAGQRDYNAEMLWLLGQPSLDEYLSFVQEKAVGGKAMPANLLADEWRAANDLFFELEKSEAGAADGADCLPLPPELEPLADALRADPYYTSTFDTLPTEIRMVELDRLMVSQKHIASVFSAERARVLGATPTPEALFRFCLPLDRPNPPVRIQRLAANRYLFSSGSTDLRAHNPILLDRNQIAGISSYGPIAGAVGLLVGFGSNFLTAIRSEERMVLHNGYHRAYTMRALGITHAPCIVETVTRTDELNLAASERVSDAPAFYFRSKRPPMLRDFFNPLLVKRLAVKPLETVVEVEFKLKSWTGTDCSD